MSVQPPPQQTDYPFSFEIFPGLAGLSSSLVGTSGYTVTGISQDGQNFTPVTTTDSSYQTSATLTGPYLTSSVNADGTFQETPSNDQTLIDDIQANEGNSTPLSQTLYYQVTGGGTTVVDSVTFNLNDVEFKGTGAPFDAPETVQPNTSTNIAGLVVDKALATGQTTDANEHLTVTVGANVGTLSIDANQAGSGGGTGETITIDNSSPTHTVTIDGTIAQINADLQGLTYTSGAVLGPDSLSVQAVDGPATTSDFVIGNITVADATQPPPQDTFTDPFQVFPGLISENGVLPGTAGLTLTGVSLDGQNFTPVNSTDPNFQTSTTLNGNYLSFAVNADGTAQETLIGGSQTLIDDIHANETNASALSDTLYYRLTDGTTTFIDATTFALNDVLFQTTGTPYTSPETVQPNTSTNIPGLAVDKALATGQTTDAGEHLVVKLGVFDYNVQHADGTLSIDSSKVGAAGGTGETITFDATTPFAMLTIDGTVAQINADLQGLTYTSGSGAGDELITEQAVDGPSTTIDFIFGEIKTACYAMGTRILVEGGLAAIETLRPGDHVVTASGERRPIVWIGQRRINLAKHPRPELVRPVRIEAGALGESLPMRDLVVSPDHALWLEHALVPARVVSPDHALWLEHALVPARELVNGATIRQESWSSVDYFHIELETHDILLAEGAPAETYLDCQNRSGFDNAPDGVVALHPDWSIKAADRPFAGAAAAARLRAGFAARASDLGRIEDLARYETGRRARGKVSRTNIVRNPRCEGSKRGIFKAGGRAGRAPTGWWLTAPEGLVIEIMRAGGENGLPFLDLRLFGRAPQSGQVGIYPEPTKAAAKAGEDWTVSCHLRRTHGALAGITSVNLYVDEYAVDGCYLAGQSFAQPLPSGDDLLLQRLCGTRRLLHPEVSGTTSYIQIETAADMPIDVTLRVAGIQIEEGAYASDLILPRPGELGPTTRHARWVAASGGASRRVA